MSGYSKPGWARPPDGKWELMEIKSGVPVQTHSLQKDCILFGRAADKVDITIAHESASRLHARVAFDRTGVPWLKDLGSTHGVTVNRKRLPKQTISKLESNSNATGSRGVVIYPTDILQFGASTRIYVLEGPDEFARGRIRKVSTPERPSAPDRPTVPRKLTDETVPESYWNEWESLKALKRKLDNIQTENERILAKGELSANQEKQIQSNEKRVVELEPKVKEKEETLFAKIFDQPTQTVTTTSTHVDEYDDDEVDDSTERTRGDDELAVVDGETEASLSRKWRDLRSKKLGLADKAKSTIVKIDRLQETVDRQTAAHDEESFFSRNDLQIARDTIKRHESEIQETETLLFEVEKLLKVVNPELQPDVVAGTLHPSEAERKRVPTPPEEPQTVPTSLSRPVAPQLDMPGDDFVLPTPVSEQILPTPVEKTGFAMPPPNKRQKGPMPPPSFSRPSESDAGQSDTWQAPKDQDGSGITKLNAKFGGRY